MAVHSACAPRPYDAVVVGAGPGGSIAALVLARGGARVALVDKATFPRSKACGDLVGPRGLALLDGLGIDVPGPRAADMLVSGPSGRVARLPAYPGRAYPDHALVCPRDTFDARLRAAALEAGAHPVPGRVSAVGTGPEPWVQVGEDRLPASYVVGADGAGSVVARQAGLVDDAAVLWGFALRGYVDAEPGLPLIALRDERKRRAYPGYGWLFPGVDGRANVGVGVGLLSERRHDRHIPADLDRFVSELVRGGHLSPGVEPAGVQGGWLKMGVAGTVPARGRVLLVGDAAGLVNPLQGEGIAQAMASGAAAARAILAGRDPAAAYVEVLRRRHLPYLQVAAPVHAALLQHPAVVSLVARAITAAPARNALAGVWSLTWNDLLEGATGRPAQRAAVVLRGLAGPVAKHTRTARRVAADLS